MASTAAAQSNSSSTTESILNSGATSSNASNRMPIRQMSGSKGIDGGRKQTPVDMTSRYVVLKIVPRYYLTPVTFTHSIPSYSHFCVTTASGISAFLTTPLLTPNLQTWTSPKSLGSWYKSPDTTRQSSLTVQRNQFAH